MSSCLGESFPIFSYYYYYHYFFSLYDVQNVMVISFLCFRDSFWPGGVLAESHPDRKKDVKVRTRVAAKTKMFGSIPGKLSCKAFSLERNSPTPPSFYPPPPLFS